MPEDPSKRNEGISQNTKLPLISAVPLKTQKLDILECKKNEFLKYSRNCVVKKQLRKSE